MLGGMNTLINYLSSLIPQLPRLSQPNMRIFADGVGAVLAI